MAFKMAAVFDKFFNFVIFGEYLHVIPCFIGFWVPGIQLKCHFYILSCIYEDKY